MLKIFTDKNFLTEAHRKIIFPLLFDLHYLQNKKILNFYQLVNTMEDATIVIVPVDIAYFYKNKKRIELRAFINKAVQLKKKVWVYSAGDVGLSLNMAEVFTFRLGGFQSKLTPNTFILPAYTIDPYQFLNEEFKSLPKDSHPSVGFVGHASGTFTNISKSFLIYSHQQIRRVLKIDFADGQAFYPSGLKRYGFLSRLQKNKNIQTNFIFRPKYRAGAKTEEERYKTTLAFFQNIKNNPYIFCLRGGGNFSVRFYETLAMGRIPFVIDTDFRLPLAGTVNWEKHCIIASEKNFMEKLIHFHENIAEEDFKQMQINNRNLWVDSLTRDNYFIKMYSVFKEKII